MSILALILLAGWSNSARACAIFDFYYTEVEQSDAPPCLEVSGKHREEVEPIISVANRCGEAAVLSWLPEGASTPTTYNVAVAAEREVSLPAPSEGEVIYNLSWEVGDARGRLDARVWVESEACPDTGLQCTVQSPSTAGSKGGIMAALMLVAFLAYRRRSLLQ
jgi:MYXO-CTERM domain-containing protein